MVLEEELIQVLGSERYERVAQRRGYRNGSELRRITTPVAVQHAWLASVLRGHYAYHGLPSNHRAMSNFYHETRRLWFRSLLQRSHRARMTWARFSKLLERFSLPTPRITQPRKPLFGSLG